MNQNFPMNPKIYLAGPINGCTDSECNDWRTEIKRLHANCLDPMARDYRGREQENCEGIVRGDKEDINACDVVIVWYERPSVGTSMEVLYAWERGKPVIIIDRSGKPLSPWLAYHSVAVCANADEAVTTALRDDLKPATSHLEYQ